MNDMHSRIRERIEVLGKSLRQASFDSGLSGEAISVILRKPEQSQTLETVQKLAAGLETTPVWLAFGVVDRDDRLERTTESSAVPCRIDEPNEEIASKLTYIDQLDDNIGILASLGDLRSQIAQALTARGSSSPVARASSKVALLRLLSLPGTRVVRLSEEEIRNGLASPAPTPGAQS